MKTIILLLCMVLFIPTQDANTTDLLKGEWTIDLRPTPSSPEYYQAMEISFVNNKTFEGSFYNSEIKAALLNTNWNKIYFSFITSDASHNYYHSGYLENGKLYGISYCPGRKFTAPWTGTLKE